MWFAWTDLVKGAIKGALSAKAQQVVESVNPAVYYVSGFVILLLFIGIVVMMVSASWRKTRRIDNAMSKIDDLEEKVAKLEVR
jgi:hypothetical protein